MRIAKEDIPVLIDVPGAKARQQYVKDRTLKKLDRQGEWTFMSKKS